MAEVLAKRPKKHALSLAGELWYLDEKAEKSCSIQKTCVAFVVSVDNPVAKDSDEENEPNDPLPIIWIQ